MKFYWDFHSIVLEMQLQTGELSSNTGSVTKQTEPLHKSFSFLML